jgi:hypothetical protein
MVIAPKFIIKCCNKVDFKYKNIGWKPFIVRQQLGITMQNSHYIKNRL